MRRLSPLTVDLTPRMGQVHPLNPTEPEPAPVRSDNQHLYDLAACLGACVLAGAAVVEPQSWGPVALLLGCAVYSGYRVALEWPRRAGR